MNEILWIIFTVTLLNFLFSLIRTYYTYKTYTGSKQYWDSWYIRKRDVTLQVLEDLREFLEKSKQ